MNDISRHSIAESQTNRPRPPSGIPEYMRSNNHFLSHIHQIQAECWPSSRSTALFAPVIEAAILIEN